MIIDDLNKFKGITEIKDVKELACLKPGDDASMVMTIEWIVRKGEHKRALELMWDTDRVTYWQPNPETNVIIGLDGKFLSFRLLPIKSPEFVNIRIIDRKEFNLPDKVNFEFRFFKDSYFIIKKIPKTMEKVLELFTLRETPL